MKYINYFWNFISSKNIDNIFGISGGAVADILSKKPNSINWINVGNELQNGFIASIYGYYTKNVGLLFTTTGPGIATALSAYKNAEAEHQPLIVISTFNPLVKEDFQWWNIKQIGDTIGNLIYIENHDEFITKLDKAYNLALKNTSVMLIININILRQIVKVPKPILLKNNNLDASYRNKINKINKINSNIISCFNKKRILIVVGKGSFIDYNIVKEFILNNELPYVTTWKQRFIIENSLYCGRLGSLGHHSANYAAIKANRILIIGNVSEELNTPFFTNKFSFIKLNKKSIVYLISIKKTSLENKNVDKYFINNNINDILSKLKISCSKKWKNTITVGKTNLFNSIQPISKLEKYIYAASQVYKNKSLKIPVTSGVGNHWYALGKYMDISRPESFESTTSWSSIGTGLTNGIGIHYATNEHVWVFEGDGGFLFSSCAFLYLLENPNLSLTITLIVDATYSAVLQTYVTKKFTNNESNTVPYTKWTSILPNYVIFTNETDYYNYLNENPTSNVVRYIILMIDNGNLNESLVYDIHLDETYIQNAKNNNFQYMINKPLIL